MDGTHQQPQPVITRLWMEHTNSHNQWSLAYGWNTPTATTSDHSLKDGTHQQPQPVITRLWMEHTNSHNQWSLAYGWNTPTATTSDHSLMDGTHQQPQPVISRLWMEHTSGSLKQYVYECNIIQDNLNEHMVQLLHRILYMISRALARTSVISGKYSRSRSTYQWMNQYTSMFTKDTTRALQPSPLNIYKPNCLKQKYLKLYTALKL